MQFVVDGVLSGAQIALLGVALSAVYLPTRVLHLALGAVYAATPFVAFAGLGGGFPPAASVAAALLAGIALSVLCELANHALLARRGASEGTHLVASLGTYIVVVQAIVLLWGSDPLRLRLSPERLLAWGGFAATEARLVAGVGALLVLALYLLWLRFSALGLRFRALADNPNELALRGFNVATLRLLAFALSGALGGSAALLDAYGDGFDANAGLSALLLAIVAVLIGGRGSLVGPALGGLLLGVVRSGVVWFGSTAWQEPVTFALLGAALLFFPSGLVGKPTRLEAQA